MQVEITKTDEWIDVTEETTPGIYLSSNDELCVIGYVDGALYVCEISEVGGPCSARIHDIVGLKVREFRADEEVRLTGGGK